MKSLNHRVVKCVRRYLSCPSGVLKYLITLKVVACLASWCRGKPFPSPSKYCLTTLITFKIPNITWDVGHPFNLYVGFQRPGWLDVLGIPSRGNLCLWTPRARATDLGRGPNVRAGSGRAPCVPRSRSTRKDPRPEEEKMSKGQKTHLYMYTSKYARFPVYMQGSPLGCVRREIPVETEVDEKGHEGNTAVAQLIYVGNMEYIFHEE